MIYSLNRSLLRNSIFDLDLWPCDLDFMSPSTLHEYKYHLYQRTFPVIIVLQKCYYLFQINELEQNYLEKDVHQKQRPRAVTLTLSIGFLWNFVHNLFFSQSLLFLGTWLQHCPYSCLNLKKMCWKIREKRPFLIYAN